MKKYLQFFVLIVGCCLIQYILFCQDNINKEYTIKFSGYETKLSKQASLTIDSIASAMKSQPTWNYAISCYMVCNARKSAASWDRVNTIVTRLTTKYGIKAERFVFRNDDNSENYDEVSFRYTDERVSTDAPPHPNLRKKATESSCTPTPLSSNY